MANNESNARLTDIPDNEREKTKNSRFAAKEYGFFSPKIFLYLLMGITIITFVALALFLAHFFIYKGSHRSCKVQPNAPHHLARLSGLKNEYLYEYTGKGIEVYVVDTGLNDKALDNKVLSRQSFNGNGNFEDEDGHGTHVAGIIGSQDYGVAKGVLFHNLKVLDEHGDGKESPMIAAIEFAINLSRKRGKKSIINLSFSAGNQSHSRIFDGAILEAVNAGLIVIAAAGNDNVDACSVSPGGSALAITVGAVTMKDEQTNFSNYGDCVSIYAVGESVPSLTIPLKNGTQSSPKIRSGSSQACAIVTGLAAIILERFPTYEQQEVYEELLNYAEKGVIKMQHGYNNFLARGFCNNRKNRHYLVKKFPLLTFILLIMVNVLTS